MGVDDPHYHSPPRRIFVLPAVLTLLLVIVPWILEFAEQHWVTPRLPYFGAFFDSLITALLGVWILVMIRREREIARRHLEEFEQLSLTDSLTGLGNRRAFERELDVALKRSQRTESPLALLYLDVDEMKKVNDHYGHVVGDETLRALGAVLRSSSRVGIDAAYRVGGDEFVMVLAADARNAEAIAERLTHNFEERSPRGSRVSSGIVVWDGETRVQQLIDEADSRMYRRKPRLGGAQA